MRWLSVVFICIAACSESKESSTSFDADAPDSSASEVSTGGCTPGTSSCRQVPLCGSSCNVCMWCSSAGTWGAEDGDDCHFKAMACEDAYAPSCAGPLPASFACLEPPERPKQKVCNDAAIQAIVKACWVTGTMCSVMKTTFPECALCMTGDRDTKGTPVGWVDVDVVDIAACVRAIDPTSGCGKTQRCMTDCVRSVCESCDRSEVGSEWFGCRASSLAAGGACTAQAAGVATCKADGRFAHCFLETTDDLLPFFRGACRDGADWSKADVGDGTLAVTDAGSD